jgi:hypothetical protein
LLYAGTEFGMYVSFDDGAHWQPFQLNLPVVPINDIKVFRKDLLIATQGRSFWIIDDLTPLHQTSAQVAAAPATLFKPRDAYRMRYQGGGGFGRGRGPAAPQYPPPGATIDFYLGQVPTGVVTLDILDEAGKLVRSFSSEAAAAVEATAAASEDDEEGPRRARPAPRVPKEQGLNRFTWDLAYPGPRDANGRVTGNGPTAVPGRYQVRLTVSGLPQRQAGVTVSNLGLTQPLVVREDPRVARDGVTLADLRDQFDHNVRVRDLASDANRAVARVRDARTRLRDASGAAADTLTKLRAVEARLVTPAVRYSTPGLQAHITYLYGMTNQADQRVGRDAKERYATLRRELDGVIAQLNQLLGPDHQNAAAMR